MFEKLVVFVKGSGDRGLLKKPVSLLKIFIFTVPPQGSVINWLIWPFLFILGISFYIQSSVRIVLAIYTMPNHI